MSCLSDFKVIPSTPRAPAILPANLEVCTKAAITFFFAFVELKSLQSAKYGETPCEGLRWYNWGIIAWDFISYIWWFVGMGRFATSPKFYPMPSMIGWISLWKYCYTINYHPFACALEGSPRMARSIKWILYPLAALQWGASIYISAYSWRSAPRLRLGEAAYDCLASRLPSAPGISSCSTEQICPNELLN